MRVRGIFIVGLLLGAPSAATFARGLSEGVGALEGTTLYLENQARHAEKRGDYSGAIVIYDELIKRHPQNTVYPKRLAYCQTQLESNPDRYAAVNQPRATTAYDAEAPLPDLVANGAAPVARAVEPKQ